MQQPVLQLDNVSFAYNKNLVFSRVGLALQKGDFAAIIGSNGTGKSTLIKLILGLLLPAGGQINLFGKERSAYNGSGQIGYLAQGQAYSAQGFPATVAEIVQAGLYPQIGPLRFIKKNQRGQVQRALELVGMQHAANRLISQLSGGQQQRVMLARVLVSQPQLMILDEPATGIDAQTALNLYSLLQELNQSLQLTILMVTHDIARAQPYLNRVFCLDSGTLLELAQEQVLLELEHRHEHPANPDCYCCEGTNLR